MATLPTTPPSIGLFDRLAKKRGRSLWFRYTTDKVIVWVLIACGSLSIFTTLAIIGILLEETRRFFALPEVTVGEFFTTFEWNPLLGEVKHFGIWPLVFGTGLVAAVSAAVALPFGLITAVYMSEYAPRRVRAFLKPVLEVLAGIPTVVYGYFALVVITPSIQWVERGFFKPVIYPIFGAIRDFLSNNLPFMVDQGHIFGRMLYSILDPNKQIEGYNVIGAGLAVGIMTLPMVCSLSEDSLQAVPRSLREGAYAVGGTKFDVSARVVVPAALSGIVASYLLAIARAVGETMIVALAAGGLAQMTIDPRDQAQTMTGYIVQIYLGDAASGGVEYYSTYAVAFMLFIMTFVLTLIGQWVLYKYREEYN